MIEPLQPAPRLYVAVQDGCDACAAMKPILSRLRQEHPLELIITELHVNRREWVILGWRPDATPAFALVGGEGRGQLIRKKTGAMSYTELKGWLAGRTRRRRRKQDVEEVAEDSAPDGAETAEVSTPAE